MSGEQWLFVVLRRAGGHSKQQHLIKWSFDTIFTPLDASIFPSKALETLDPQIKPSHCGNAFLVADFWHGAWENMTSLFWFIFKPVCCSFGCSCYLISKSGPALNPPNHLASKAVLLARAFCKLMCHLQLFNFFTFLSILKMLQVHSWFHLEIMTVSIIGYFPRNY